MVGCVARPVSKGMEKFRGKSPDVYVWEPPRVPGRAQVGLPVVLCI